VVSQEGLCSMVLLRVASSSKGFVFHGVTESGFSRTQFHAVTQSGFSRTQVASPEILCSMKLLRVAPQEGLCSRKLLRVASQGLSSRKTETSSVSHIYCIFKYLFSFAGVSNPMNLNRGQVVA
jgi:hypothetical protein